MIEDHAIRVQAAFVSDFSIGGVLGRRGFFEEFRVVFDAPARPPYFEIER